MSSPQSVNSNQSSTARSNNQSNNENIVDNFIDAVTGENSDHFPGLSQSESNRGDNPDEDTSGEVGEESQQFDEEGKAAGDGAQSNEWTYTTMEDAVAVKEENGKHFKVISIL